MKLRNVKLICNEIKAFGSIDKKATYSIGSLGNSYNSVHIIKKFFNELKRQKVKDVTIMHGLIDVKVLFNNDQSQYTFKYSREN